MSKEMSIGEVIEKRGFEGLESLKSSELTVGQERDLNKVIELVNHWRILVMIKRDYDDDRDSEY